jgi:zinc-binding alcohol dehydrogenase family protein
MKAVGLYKYLPIDHPESLLDVEVPKPEARGRDLLVRVRAVSVNPVDTKVRAPKDKVETEPKILGWDAAGTVEAVGEEVSLFQPGDEVYYAGSITRPGCDAEYHLVDERIAAHKPQRLSFAEAAAMPLTTITAWEALFDRMGVSPWKDPGQAGRSLLVIGGAGGVGSIAIQIARQVAGLSVVATASRPETAAWCRELGADEVIDHREPLPEGLRKAGAGEVDYIFCCNSLEAYVGGFAEMIKPQGKICTIIGAKGGQPVNVNALQAKSATFCFELMFTRPQYQTPDMQKQHDLLREAARLLDEGTLRPTMRQSLGPLDAANLRRAHAAIEGGHTLGKLVLEGIG